MALVNQHRSAFITAAMGLFQSVTSLHGMMNFNQTNMSLIIFYYFETAALLSLCVLRLLSLCVLRTLDSNESQEWEVEQSNLFSPHAALCAGMVDISRNQCMRVVEEIWSQLKMMSLGNAMAKAGARQVGILVDRIRMRRSSSHTPSILSAENAAYNFSNSTSYGGAHISSSSSETQFPFPSQNLAMSAAYQADEAAFEGLMPWSLSTDALGLDRTS
jgi:hypothetical protein